MRYLCQVLFIQVRSCKLNYVNYCSCKMPSAALLKSLINQMFSYFDNWGTILSQFLKAKI